MGDDLLLTIEGKSEKAPRSCSGCHDPRRSFLISSCCAFLEEHRKAGHPVYVPGGAHSVQGSSSLEAHPLVLVQAMAWSPPTLSAIPRGWGLLSSGKLPAAALPGSFHGWDPTESLTGEREEKSGGHLELRLSNWIPSKEGPGERLPAGARGTVHLGKCSSLGQGIHLPPLLVPELHGDLA